MIQQKLDALSDVVYSNIQGTEFIHGGSHLCALVSEVMREQVGGNSSIYGKHHLKILPAGDVDIWIPSARVNSNNKITITSADEVGEFKDIPMNVMKGYNISADKLASDVDINAFGIYFTVTLRSAEESAEAEPVEATAQGKTFFKIDPRGGRGKRDKRPSTMCGSIGGDDDDDDDGDGDEVEEEEEVEALSKYVYEWSFHPRFWEWIAEPSKLRVVSARTPARTAIRIAYKGEKSNIPYDLTPIKLTNKCLANDRIFTSHQSKLQELHRIFDQSMICFLFISSDYFVMY